MTAPNQPAPPGAFVLGTGFGQGLTEGWVKSLWKPPTPTLETALDALEAQLLKMPLEALEVFKPIIPDWIEDDFASVAAAVTKVMSVLVAPIKFLSELDWEQFVTDLRDAISQTYAGDNPALQGINNLFIFFSGAMGALFNAVNGIDLEIDGGILVAITDADNAVKLWIRESLTGITGATPTQLDDWLVSLLTGESDLDAGKLVNLEDIGDIAKEKITGLVSQLSDIEDDVANALADSAQALRDELTGIVNATPTDVDDWVLGLLTGSSSLDATKLINTIADARIPTLSQSKISGLVSDLAGKLTPSSSLNAANLVGSVAAALISGTLGTGNIPTLPQSKISGLVANLADKLTSASDLDATKLVNVVNPDRLPDITRDMSSDIQGTLDAAINAIRNTTGVIGQGFSELELALSEIPTALFNKFGGNSSTRASTAEAEAAMAGFADTLSQQGIAISQLQGLLEGGQGFKEAVTFQPNEITTFSSPGSFSYTLPGWFNTATDFLDVVVLGAGGGGGGGLINASTAGGGSAFRVAGVDVATAAGGASVGPEASPDNKGKSPGSQTITDIIYAGGGAANIQATGSSPGGGGGGGLYLGVTGKGGNCGYWDWELLDPGEMTGALTGVVGAGGAGSSPGYGAGTGAPGRVWANARAGVPTKFTYMGTLGSLRMYKLNTGEALTDAQTSWATWSRTPLTGSTGGHALMVRANSGFTSYVYLWVKNISGVTNYELGRVVSGTKTSWKTGTIGSAVPFNAFSLTSDDDYTFVASINGVPFDSYTDAGHASMKGASYRWGGWASTDSGPPGSIQYYSFLDSGLPARITSHTVATGQGTTSTSYTNLGTVGPSVSLTVPSSGEVTVNVAATVTTQPANQTPYMSFELSGSNTASAADAKAALTAPRTTAGPGGTLSRTFHLTGLTPGTTTFTAKYRVSGGTASTFADRTIIVDPKH